MTAGIIILEGADGTGKTTIARHLVNYRDAFYIHLRKHDNMWRHHLAALRYAVRLMIEGRRLVVLDRHWVSECIYARVYRKGCVYGAAARRLHSVLLRYGAVNVICAPPPGWVVQQHAELNGRRVEMYDDVGEVAERYWNLVHGLEYSYESYGLDENGLDYVEQLTARGGVGDDWCHVDISREDDRRTREVCDKILSALSWKSAARVRYDGWNLTGNGHNVNSTAIVGDRVANVESPVRWPFCANHGSSLYLARAIHHLRLDEQDLCYVNACEPEGPDGLDGIDIIDKIDHPTRRYVVLGREAWRAIARTRVSLDRVTYVRHPQHARRFTHHDIAGYAAEIATGVIE